jgi:TolA-binding protein
VNKVGFSNRYPVCIRYTYTSLMSSRITAWVPGLLAAAGIAGLLSWLMFDSPKVSSPPKPAVVAAKQDPAAIEPPPASGQPMVAASNNEPLFAEAMRYYRQNDYSGASVALQRATAQQPENPEIRFYLGICYLMTNDTHAGIRELRVAGGLGSSPYLDRVHYYLAKAFLKQKDTTNAMRELAAIDNGGNLAESARKLKGELANAE